VPFRPGKGEAWRACQKAIAVTIIKDTAEFQKNAIARMNIPLFHAMASEG
jgi:hypothetical protein